MSAPFWPRGIDVAVKKPTRVPIPQQDRAAPWCGHKWPIRYAGNVSDVVSTGRKTSRCGKGEAQRELLFQRKGSGRSLDG